MSTRNEKAYKLLALQEGISNKKAKELIDRGLVFVGNKKVVIARGELPAGTRFEVQEVKALRVIFEDDKILAVDKPAFVNSEEVEGRFEGASLLHRLDRETSGVLLLSKDEDFAKKAIQEFKVQRVYKEYTAWVEGIVAEAVTVDKPIQTIKAKRAYSKISSKGKAAKSIIEPLMIAGKKSKVKVVITSGRTHQIRVHLKSIDHPIIGDVQYGGRPAGRMMLHAKKIELLGYSFESPEPADFARMEG